MKKKYTITDKTITIITGWIAVFTVIALAAWGVWTLHEYYVNEQTNDAQVQQYVNPVISRAGGFIVAVKYEENQDVKKGDTLLLIDNREYVTQADQTIAAIQKTEAQLAALESNIHTLDKSATAARYASAADKSKLWQKELDYNRYSKLYQANSATQQQLEHEKAGLEVSKADYDASESNFQASSSRVQDAVMEKAVLAAEIKRLKSLLARQELDVSYTVIRAPYNGRIGRRTVEKGQMIDAGQVLAYIVNEETDKWVVANYKETQVANMHLGDTAFFTADAFPGKTFSGTIISFSPATGSSFSLLPPDNSTGNYVKIVQRIPVRIKVDGPNGELALLRAGMNVNVSIPKKDHRE
ncbi:HlyD family secretion protein [Danxiaibacter flavus]|uniref:HlyD family secretion protein n=1 Tax=Danxiaibacter flavus TaxID=3049108 RepID=A0ABV3ZLR9_9BACT|nr:HlyD family secretion protein [Chitinophagaceae bacterium DXS]